MELPGDTSLEGGGWGEGEGRMGSGIGSQGKFTGV